MRALALDANALISLFDGDDEVRDAMAMAEKIYIPAIALGEILLGFNETKRGRAARKALDALMELPCVEVLPVGCETASCFATIFRYLKEQGQPIPQDDLWIAANVLETGAVLFTRDEHLTRIPMIRVLPSD